MLLIINRLHKRMEYGGRARVGEVRQWADGQYRKVAPGKWEPVGNERPPLRELAKIARRDLGGANGVTSALSEAFAEAAPDIDRHLRTAAVAIAEDPAVKQRTPAVTPTRAVDQAKRLHRAYLADPKMQAIAVRGLHAPEMRSAVVNAMAKAIAKVSVLRASVKGRRNEQALERDRARAAGKKTGEPSRAKAIARTVLSAASGPFLFGFIDNFLLYIAGASIDKALATAGFSAAAVAGLGNAVSDTIGQRYADQLEGVLGRMGLGKDATEGVLSEKTEKRIRAWSSQAGIFAGALAGMVPLLFGVKFGKSMDLTKANEKPPGGFSPIPNSTHGGYHRKVGNSYVYWYPGQGLTRNPRSSDKGSGSKRPLVVRTRRDAAKQNDDRIANGKRASDQKSVITDPAALPEGFNDLPKQKRAVMTAKWSVVEQQMADRFGAPRQYVGPLEKAIGDHIDDMVAQGYIARGNTDRAKKMLATMARYGADAGVPADKLASLMEENVRKLAHQEVESLSRTLGDHGVRHLAVNAEQSDQILEQLKRGGINTSPMDHFMAAQVWIDHDMGYAIPAIAQGGFAVKDNYHPQASALLSLHQQEKFEGVFGKSGFRRYARAVANHSASDVDWKGDYFGSAVRLADNTHLFADKMPEVLFDSNAAVEAMVKIRLASEAVKATGEGGKHTPEEKARFKSLVGNVKSALIDQIKARDDLAENTRGYILKAAQEIGAMTPKFLISRLAGRSPKFDFDGRDMRVVIEQSAARETIGQVFGDDETDKQFNKLLTDYGSSPEKALGAKPPPPHVRIGDTGNGIEFIWQKGGRGDPVESRHAKVMRRVRAEYDKISSLKGDARDAALDKFFGAKLAKALAALTGKGNEMGKSLTPSIDEWLQKTMVSKQGHELHFDELEEKIRRQGGADDPAAVAAKIYRRAGGVPSKTSRSSKKLKRQKKEREEKSMRKGGPFIGPRGGKWADAAHTIPWKESKAIEYHHGQIQKHKDAIAHLKQRPKFLLGEKFKDQDGSKRLSHEEAINAHGDALSHYYHGKNSDDIKRARELGIKAKKLSDTAFNNGGVTQAKKSAQTVRIGNLDYAIGTSDELADRLEKGDFQVGGMAAFTLAGPAMKRSELPCLAPENEARHQQEILDQTVTLDAAGWGGAGGLDEWWRNSLKTADQYSLNVPHEASNVLRHYVQHAVVVEPDDLQYQSVGKAARRQG